jgi:hypothetical protein
MKIKLDRASGISGYIVTLLGTDKDTLVQTDYDYPSLASTFGWDMRETQVMNAGYYGVLCTHSQTDGTVNCPQCGLTPTTFINDADTFLSDNLGAIAEDPGYFESEESN